MRQRGLCPYRRLCDAGQISMETIERVAWAAVWEILAQPALLLKLGEAYYDAIGRPGRDKVEALEAERRRLENRRDIIKQMIRDGIEEYSKGLVETRALGARLKDLAEEIRAAGKVVNLPSLAQAKAGMRTFVENEPQDSESRREILDAILDLKRIYDDETRTLTLEGKIPV